MTKSEFIQSIQMLVADGKTEEALTLLRTQAAEYDPSVLPDVTLVESRFKQFSNDFFIKGTLTREEFDSRVANVNYAVLEILEKLSKTNPLSIVNRSQGRLLHRIPGTMPVGKETRCVVRIAYDDENLLRDIKIDENTVVQNVRIAEVMGVELIDFNETPSFTIRTVTEEEQFIVSDDYTQWIFMVKPLRAGTYPLTLKVSVIEQIDGRERRRDIVLEKEISIVTEAADTPVKVVAQPFEDPNITLNMADDASRAAAAPPPPLAQPTAQPASATASEVPSKRGAVGALAAIVGFLVVAMTGLWVVTRPSAIELPSGDTGGGMKGGGTIAQADSSKKEPVEKGEIFLLDSTKGELAQQANPTKPITINAAPKVDAPPKLNEDTGETSQTSYKKYANKSPRSRTDNAQGAAGQGTKSGANQIANGTNNNPNGSNKSPNAPKQPEVRPKSVELDVERTYRVRVKVEGEMKNAQILVDGAPVTVKRNVWGTPQYIEFKSRRLRHDVTFKGAGVSCTVKDVLIDSENAEIEACNYKKKK